MFIWQGNGAGTKTEWEDGRNWLDEYGTAYAEARYPGSITDIFDEVLLPNALETGASSPAGFDGSALEELASFMVGRDFDGSVGSSGSVQVLDTGGTWSSGTFTLAIAKIGGGTETTSALAYNISNANIKIAIDAILLAAGYTGATVTLTGGPVASADVTVTFGGTASSVDMPLLVADDGSLAGSYPTLSVATTSVKIKCRKTNINAVQATGVYLDLVECADESETTVSAGYAVSLKGYVGTFYCSNGVVTINDNAELTDPTIVKGDIDPTVTIGKSVTITSVLNVLGGNVTCYSHATINQNSGTYTHEAEIEADSYSTYEGHGGTFYWNDDSFDTITADNSVDASSGQNARSFDTMRLLPNAVVNLDNGLGNIACTDHVEYVGGTLTPAVGYAVEQYRDKTYAGASNAKLGIAPQSVAGGGSVDGDDIHLGRYDKLEVIVQVGATDATQVACSLHECADPSTHTDEALLTGHVVTFVGTDDNQTKIITLWGYEMSPGMSNVRAKITLTGGTAALVAAACIVSRA